MTRLVAIALAFGLFFTVSAQAQTAQQQVAPVTTGTTTQGTVDATSKSMEDAAKGGMEKAKGMTKGMGKHKGKMKGKGDAMGKAKRMGSSKN